MKHFVLNIRKLLIIKMLINSNYFVCRSKSQTPKDIVFSVSWGKEKTSYIHIWEASGSEFWVFWWFCRAAYQLIEKIKVNTFHVELKCFLEYYRIAIWPSKTFFFKLHHHHFDVGFFCVKPAQMISYCNICQSFATRNVPNTSYSLPAMRPIRNYDQCTRLVEAVFILPVRDAAASLEELQNPWQ